MTRTFIRHVFFQQAAIPLLWWAFGYSLAFNGEASYYGNFGKAFLIGVSPDTPYPDNEEIPEYLFVCFSMMFPIVACAILSGGFYGKIYFKPAAIIMALWVTLVYCPVAHWIWGQGWLRALGTQEFAGGMVVHTLCGASSLALSLFVKLMNGADERVDRLFHSHPLSYLGLSLLWVGWFGFNAGSALAADAGFALALLNTHISAAVGCAVWEIKEEISQACHQNDKHKLHPDAAIMGTIVGLVAITPCAGGVTTWGAALVSLLTSLIVLAFWMLREFLTESCKTFHIPDPFDVWLLHGVAGGVGSVLTGFFSSRAANPLVKSGVIEGNSPLLGAQLAAVVSVSLFGFIFTLGIVGFVYLIAKYVLKTDILIPANTPNVDQHTFVGGPAYAYTKDDFGVIQEA